MAGSIFFVHDMKTSMYQRYRQDYVLEAIGLTLHYLWSAAVFVQYPTWSTMLMAMAVSELLAGFGIAIVVFFNHYSCEKYDPVLADNFVCLQLYTTRNMTPGLWTDWICGGLNYQVEHHLFPTMPRHNLYRCSKKVKQFCKSHNLPYLCSDFTEGLQYVLDYLGNMGQICQERYPNA